MSPKSKLYCHNGIKIIFLIVTHNNFSILYYIHIWITVYNRRIYQEYSYYSSLLYTTISSTTSNVVLLSSSFSHHYKRNFTFSLLFFLSLHFLYKPTTSCKYINVIKKKKIISCRLHHFHFYGHQETS